MIETQATAVVTTIVISKPPFSCIDAKEGVDLALVCAAFDHLVNLLFVDAGVLHLIEAQNGSFYDDKMHDKQLKALEFYEVEKVFAEAESIEKYSLKATDLIDLAKIIDRAEINQLCQTSHHLVNI